LIKHDDSSIALGHLLIGVRDRQTSFLGESRQKLGAAAGEGLQPYQRLRVDERLNPVK
jgi:hypothetical protein